MEVFGGGEEQTEGGRKTWLLMEESFWKDVYREVPQATGTRVQRTHTLRDGGDYERIVLTGWQLLVTGEVKSSALLPL